jgi:hypothetical protein
MRSADRLLPTESLLNRLCVQRAVRPLLMLDFIQNNDLSGGKALL